MTRYLLAGIAMTTSVVLLFLASFRPAAIPSPNDQAVLITRTDAQAIGRNHADPQHAQTAEAASAPLVQGDPASAVASLQEQIRKAAATLASLESQVTQTRQDLASLKVQRGQPSKSDQSATIAAPDPDGNESVSRGSPRAARGDSGQAKPVADLGAPEMGAANTVNGPKPGPQIAAIPNAPNPEATQSQVRTAPNQASLAAASGHGLAVDQSARGGAGALPQTERTQPLPAVQHQRPTDTRPPDSRLADAQLANPGSTRAYSSTETTTGDVDPAQAALNRLRRQTAASKAPSRPDTGNEPHRVPTMERLQDARAAVIDGRIEDARRYLQAAQVQLVFRPVGPGQAQGQDQPRISQATGPVSQALLALSTGDRGRAIIAIDQAAGALDSGSEARQFGSLPQSDGQFLPIVPR